MMMADCIIVLSLAIKGHAPIVTWGGEEKVVVVSQALCYDR